MTTDPAFAGQSKPKFIVMLSNSALDDPIYYILTTSQKPKHVAHPYPNDLISIPAGTYPFFPVETIIDVGEAGRLEIDRVEFAALFDEGTLPPRPLFEVTILTSKSAIPSRDNLNTKSSDVASERRSGTAPALHVGGQPGGSHP